MAWRALSEQVANSAVTSTGQLELFQRARKHIQSMRVCGWGARIRTWEWRYQKPLPYRLATPQRSSRYIASSQIGCKRTRLHSPDLSPQELRSARDGNSDAGIVLKSLAGHRTRRYNAATSGGVWRSLVAHLVRDARCVFQFIPFSSTVYAWRAVRPWEFPWEFPLRRRVSAPKPPLRGRREDPPRRRGRSASSS